MALSLEDFSINTIVGQGSSVSGNVSIAGFVRIDGDIDGNLETSGKIILGEKARVRGNITARSAVIGGIVEGDILAPEGVQLFSTSIVVGDIVTKRIEVAEQVIFHGHCIALRNEGAFEAARQDRLTAMAVGQRGARA
ncbi:MAG: polymer-forming cytoskeletal protein [Spirochaetaceae bacterium]|jgi:cytoskeletal protein CcmA (bactofilin family)|nr:polymer-forming cytoskeletal protein [Spirochaetaceae bacterium]